MAVGLYDHEMRLPGWQALLMGQKHWRWNWNWEIACLLALELVFETRYAP